ncbi:MAG TPA: quinone-dependent dihydroorotate dehydrogenase [Euzebya sp.]|nr:quinone-dependent dihydroorotate dehydrogenase [Euzebya sp.]
MIYRLVFDRLLTRVDPETAHSITLRLLRAARRIPGLLALVRRAVGHPDPALAVTALGLTFPTPLGVAAGFDKDAEVVDAMTALGFGFVEVGTVTARPQPGNPRPRMARLPADRALVNRMGFNNRGAAHAAANLRRRHRVTPVGANIGRTKVVEAPDAPADYAASARLLAPLCDYLVVNVSSPNTPGLRDLQAVSSLRPLLQAVLDACQEVSSTPPPVLVKIAPDLVDEDVDAIADLAVDLGLAGIIAANTSISRAGLASDAATVEAAGGGGLSGAPLKARSMTLLTRLHARVGDRLTIISVGGIESADDVWDRLVAGAALVQSYTGMVYGGPSFARHINSGLRRRMQREGVARLQDLTSQR